MRLSHGVPRGDLKYLMICICTSGSSSDLFSGRRTQCTAPSAVVTHCLCAIATAGGRGGGGAAGGHDTMLVEPAKKNDACQDRGIPASEGMPLRKLKLTWLVDKNSKVTASLRWSSVSASGSVGLSAFG